MFGTAYASLVSGDGDHGETSRRNFFLHIALLSASKIGDRLIDPKLVLSWLLGALSVPGWMIGLLVPVREAGALLPQIALSNAVGRSPVRKWWWAAGALGQGVSVLGMAACAAMLDGAAAGYAILGCLACFAVARSVCSVSYKDVLGKTVRSGARGTATGLASSAAAVGALIFGALLAFGIVPKTVAAIVGVLVVAACLWALASFISTRLSEPESERRENRGSILSQFRYLREDPQLTRFIVVRGLLTVTALAPPYLVAVTGQGGFSFEALGPFVMASAVAAMTSGYVWGRFSDRSSRTVLQIAALAAGAVLALAAGFGAMGWTQTWLYSGLLYLLMVAYEGVRNGRSTHLVDMAPEDRRAAYTAVSNTVIGVILLIGGGFGFLSDMFGQGATLLLFAAICGVAAWAAYGLDEVQRE